MSKLVKIAIILATAALLIAAKQTLPVYSSDPAISSAVRPSVSPIEMMRTTGPLPETFLDDYL